MKAIHIGFPKTATTFLQTAVFPKLTNDGFVYFGMDPSARFFASLMDDDDTIFDVATMTERVCESRDFWPRQRARVAERTTE